MKGKIDRRTWRRRKEKKENRGEEEIKGETEGRQWKIREK